MEMCMKRSNKYGPYLYSVTDHSTTEVSIFHIHSWESP